MEIKRARALDIKGGYPAMEQYKQEFIEFVGLCFSDKLLTGLEVA